MQDVEPIVCGDYGQYLGLPTMISRSKYNAFRGEKEHMEQYQQLEEFFPL